jgi:hypothetical protein
MSLQFVKVITVYPKKIALQTEAGITSTVPESERHLLEPLIEKAVIARNLPGYIEHNGQFKRVER